MLDWQSAGDLPAAAGKACVNYRTAPCFHDVVAIRQNTAFKVAKPEAWLSKAVTIGMMEKIQDLRLKFSLARDSERSAHADLLGIA